MRMESFPSTGIVLLLAIPYRGEPGEVYHSWDFAFVLYLQALMANDIDTSSMNDYYSGQYNFQPRSLARRSVRAVTWNAIANFIKLPISWIQSVILARLLPVDYFGIVAGMTAVIVLSKTFFSF